MKIFLSLFITLVTLLLVLVGCASGVTPSPTTAIQPPATTSTAIPTTTTTSTAIPTTTTSTVIPTTTTSAAAPETVVMGLNTFFSGPSASAGLAAQRGGQYLVDQANKAGIKVGNKSYIFKVAAYDSQMDPAKSLENVKRMIDTDKAVMIASLGGAATVAIVPTVSQLNMILLTTAPTKSVLSTQYPYNFRVGPDSLLGTIAAYGYCKDSLKLKTVLLVAPDDQVGVDSYSDTNAAAGMTGIQVLGAEYYKRGTTDLYPVLSRVIYKNPDIIDCGTSAIGDTYQIIKQAYELGFKGIFTGTTPLNVDDLKKTAGEAALGNVLFTTPGVPDDPKYLTPEEQAFKQTMIGLYGKNGALFDMTFADLLSTSKWAPLYIQAIQMANSFDSNKVKQALETGTFSILGRQFQFGLANLYGIGHQLKMPITLQRVINGTMQSVGVYSADNLK